MRLVELQLQLCDISSQDCKRSQGRQYRLGIQPFRNQPDQSLAFQLETPKLTELILDRSF
jgi:hypothetical protein